MALSPSLHFLFLFLYTYMTLFSAASSTDSSYKGMERHRRDNPSFSSTLLDSIYRSIDQGEPLHSTSFRTEEQHIPSFRLPMDKKLIFRRKSMEDFDRIGSSDSGFSSSESGSTWTSSVKSNPPPCYNYASQRPKSTRNSYNSMDLQQHQGGGFVKTKSRALKKVKQPISPGGRLANFLNSIFTSVNAKKPKIDNSDRKCSSAVSRSCLSKTPSSQEKVTKRSVRFCPVSVIVDEDCRHKNPHQEDLKFSHVLEEKRRVQEAAQDLLNNYRQIQNQTVSDGEDDDASCSSSDLFELDNLSVIGMGRYREELPVYETTHLATNRAIAKGFIIL